ncbi:helix-turn-helix transcriptional regulator [Methylobacterium iners]|uniref:HTH luxR-type domain-containing protein n=1 Tax=Methylobacterium iners TaxID=418707 RepID=A0ABQ4S5F3_9HYPH|nr:helix-turn-helix transcriptional regulator [Methylobacterium iners]GJD97714.1 hypothetical protein OCOJLMKI_4947 [Methylobacterium iners]
MKADREFSQLVGRIYDCALDNSIWPSVLGEITEAMNGLMGDLTVVDPVNKTGYLAARHNWPDDVARLATENFHINPNAAFILTMPLMEPKCSSRDLDIAAFHRSRYWRLCFAGRGYYDYLVTAISRERSRFAGWGILGSERRGPFTDEDLELAALLSPHIRRSTEISGLLEHRRIAAGTLRSALDALAAPTFIIDPGGEIGFVNAAARMELERGVLFRQRRNRLFGATPDAAALLADLKANPQRGRDVLLAAPDGCGFHVTWAFVDQAGEVLGRQILVVLRELEPELQTPICAAARLYKLTVAETQVLAQVLECQGLSEVADLLGVARSTVKTHLDAIYRKTDTRRRSELVRRVLALTSSLRTPSEPGRQQLPTDRLHAAEKRRAD